MIAIEGFNREDYQRNHHNEKRKDSQNCGPITPCEDLVRRFSTERSLEKWCLTYFAGWFPLPFCNDHLRVIAKAEAAVIDGLLFAFAMPRGSGKTTIAKACAMWAIMHGHRRWVEIVAATGKMAEKILTDIKKQLRTNNMLLRDFPEVCVPFAHLEGSPLRARGQHLDGAPTFIEWGKEQTVFPVIKGTKCGESRITCHSIDGAIRGQQASTQSGEMIRPDMVIGDDPQTKASAKSLMETEYRREIIMGDILGLSGPTSKIAGLFPVTVIRKDDLACNLTDQKKSPEFRGERTKLVVSFPDADAKWEEYFRLRENDLASGGDGSCATTMYRNDRKSMDLGGVVAWPERFPPPFASALEYAMFLRYRDPDAFAAEMQNEPIEQDGDDIRFLTSQEVIGKQNSFARGTSPIAATHLTAFVDVQQDSLWWMVCAWASGFDGWIVDYGTYPKQSQSYYTKYKLRSTLSTRFPNMGTEGAIHAGLAELVDNLASRDWKRDDGHIMPKPRILVDSGKWTETIYAFTRSMKDRHTVMPSKGIGVTAANMPMYEYKKKPGERIGLNWIVSSLSTNKAINLLKYDTNFWKTFIQTRLKTATADSGSLSLFKASHFDHRLVADHIAASETPTKTEGRGRTLLEWVQKPERPDNEWLDCLVGCAVGASYDGITIETLKPQAIQQAKPRRKVSYL